MFRTVRKLLEADNPIVYVTRTRMKEFLSLLHGLTPEEKDACELLGMGRRVRSAWKTGRRLPTATNVSNLAVICERDPLPLFEELAVAQAQRKIRG